MAKSIRSSQSEVLDSGFLDLMDVSNRSDYKETTLKELKSTGETLSYLAALYVQIATNNLDKHNKVSTGLLNSAIIGQVQIIGKVYSIEIKLADYYKFVDEGVDGWGQSHGSKYKFKNYPKGGSRGKKSKFVDALKQWLIKEGKIGQIKHKHTITTREKKQQSITDTSTKAAIGAMMVIKKKGIEPTHFWTDTEKQIKPMAEKLLGQAIKVDIINSILNK